MLTLDLLRHGALEGGIKYRGHVDDPLTPEGREQMENVWRELHQEIDLIITSPLTRCAEPASAWARGADIECIVEPRVSEMFYGEWEGKTISQIKRSHPGLLEQWRNDPTGMRPPGGESPEELRERITAWWDEACIKHNNRHVLLLAHSGSLRMLITHILAAPIAATRHLEMPYACWSRISHKEGDNILLFHNINSTG